MKNMIKSISLILFVLFVLGMTYINSLILLSQKNVSATNTDNQIIFFEK